MAAYAYYCLTKQVTTQFIIFFFFFPFLFPFERKTNTINNKQTNAHRNRTETTKCEWKFSHIIRTATTTVFATVYIPHCIKLMNLRSPKCTHLQKQCINKSFENQWTARAYRCVHVYINNTLSRNELIFIFIWFSLSISFLSLNLKRKTQFNSVNEAHSSFLYILAGFDFVSINKTEKNLFFSSRIWFKVLISSFFFDFSSCFFYSFQSFLFAILSLFLSHSLTHLHSFTLNTHIHQTTNQNNLNGINRKKCKLTLYRYE